ALRSAEMVRERDELGPLAEMAVAAAVAIGRGDRRGAERAAVVAALEGEHQALAVRGVADELEGILDGLRAADVEVHAALLPELRLGVAGDQRRKLDLLAMQVLARDLRQAVDLALQGLVQALVGVAEVDRRVPHLEIEERRAGEIVEERALAGREDLRRLGVVHGVAVRAVLRLEREKLGFLLRDRAGGVVRGK